MASQSVVFPDAGPCRPSPADFVADLGRWVADPRVGELCDRLAAVEARAFRKSWLGINLRGGGLLGVKLYFTFYERLGDGDLARVLPDAAVRFDFLAWAARVSPEHASNPLHPGSGYTFCLKLDGRGEATLGFYLRVGAGETGVFRLYGREPYAKEYSYVVEPAAREELARRFGLPALEGCEVIEHGRGRGHGFESGERDEKIILIGNFERIRPRLFDAGDLERIAAVEQAWGLRAACGGIYLQGVKSVYFAGPREEDGNRVRTVERIREALARGGS